MIGRKSEFIYDCIEDNVTDKTAASKTQMIPLSHLMSVHNVLLSQLVWNLRNYFRYRPSSPPVIVENQERSENTIGVRLSSTSNRGKCLDNSALHFTVQKVWIDLPHQNYDNPRCI